MKRLYNSYQTWLRTYYEINWTTNINSINCCELEVTTEYTSLTFNSDC